MHPLNSHTFSNFFVFNSVCAEGINIFENIIAAGTDKIDELKNANDASKFII